MWLMGLAWFTTEGVMLESGMFNEDDSSVAWGFLCIGWSASAVEKSRGACWTSSSMARVWCTVSMRELREADPSAVRSRVGPNTIPN